MNKLCSFSFLLSSFLLYIYYDSISFRHKSERVWYMIVLEFSSMCAQNICHETKSNRRRRCRRWKRESFWGLSWKHISLYSSTLTRSIHMYLSLSLLFVPKNFWHTFLIHSFTHSLTFDWDWADICHTHIIQPQYVTVCCCRLQ